MIDINTKETFSEVYNILDILGPQYIQKLPITLIKMIEEVKDEKYYKDLKIEDINLRNFKKESIAIIMAFYLKYWCESIEEKKKIYNIISENERKHQEKLKIQYSKELFTNKINVEKRKEEENTLLAPIEKKGIFYKIKMLLKKFLNKK